MQEDLAICVASRVDKRECLFKIRCNVLVPRVLDGDVFVDGAVWKLVWTRRSHIDNVREVVGVKDRAGLGMHLRANIEEWEDFAGMSVAHHALTGALFAVVAELCVGGINVGEAWMAVVEKHTSEIEG